MRASILILLTAVLLAGCDPAPAVHHPDRDDAGRIVIVGDSVTRIVSLAPGMTEVVFAAGAGDLLVAVTTADDHPAEVEGLPAISALPVDFEAVARLAPDIVLATVHVNSVRDARAFDNLNIPVFYFRFETLHDVSRAVRRVGAMTGRSDRADAAADNFEARLETFRRDAASVDHPPSVLFLVSSEVLYSVGSGSYVNDMIAAAGGSSVTSEIRSPAPVLSDEFVLGIDPDVIVGTFGSGFDADALQRARPSWAHLRAIRAGRVYSVPADYFHRPGPRVIDGIDTLAHILHFDASVVDEQ